MLRTLPESASSASPLADFYLHPFTFLNCNCDYDSFKWILWGLLAHYPTGGGLGDLGTLNWCQKSGWMWDPPNFALSNCCGKVIGSIGLFDICGIHLSEKKTSFIWKHCVQNFFNFICEACDRPSGLKIDCEHFFSNSLNKSWHEKLLKCIYFGPEYTY